MQIFLGKILKKDLGLEKKEKEKNLMHLSKGLG
jgi:hypothetical protein